MKAIGASLVSLSAALWALPASAQSLPEGLEDLLRGATDAERESIENVAKRLYPNSRDEIDDIVDRIEDEEEAEVAQRGALYGWDGEVSAGASWTSGNSEEWNVYAGLDVTREGPNWEHSVNAEINLRDVSNERTEERIEVGYRARRDFSGSPWFVFGQVQYDRDRFQGINRRFTEGIGVGYQIIDTDDIDWEVTAGPALRQTAYSDDTKQNELGGFTNTAFDWDITDTLAFSQDLGVVVDKSSSTLSSRTSLTADVYGRLSARITFTLDRESDPPGDAKKVDTQTRLTLVYNM